MYVLFFLINIKEVICDFVINIIFNFGSLRVGGFIGYNVLCIIYYCRDN